MNLWFTQILAVIRLEWSKTFFAKRGLWIYILALMPLVLFGGHSISGLLPASDRRLRGRHEHLRDGLPVFLFAAGDFLRLRRNLHEPDSRRNAGPQSALLFSRADPKGSADGREIYGRIVRRDR